MMVLCRTGMLFLLCSLFLWLRGTAQSADTSRLDTTVADTVVVGGEAAPGPESAIDTSSLVEGSREMGSQDAVALRSVPDSVIDAYKKNPRFAYANDPAYWRHQPEKRNHAGEWLVRILSSRGFRYFIYIALAGLLLFVVIRVMSENNVGAFYRRRIGRSPGQQEEEEPAEEDIDERLQHYLGIGDHRRATRYLYLRSLRELSQRGLINPARQATNQDYLRQLGGTAQERPFRFLTSAYEKVWYGEFPLGEEQFQRLYRHFVDFDKIVLLLLLPVALLLGSCGMGGRKELNRRISLSRHDDIPYGAKIAYESLPHIFPDADISVNSNSNPVSSNNTTGPNHALILIGTTVAADESEVNAVMNFVQQGNLVFISANRISENLLKEVSIRATRSQSLGEEEPDSLTVGVYSPVDAGYKTFSYPGDSYDNYVTKLDSQYTTVLGRDGHGRPNFVRLTYKGGGAIYLHFAPLAFSNFFLLHKQNMAYYENALSYLSPNTRSVIWDEYFRYGHQRPFSALQYILGNTALRWAFWLLLLLFAIIYIFDSRRRQRQIPVIGALKNTSLDFVQTIGRLYYQRRDNHNLATKMVVHFQDQVRTRFHLAVTNLDEAFVDRLAHRTGYPKESLMPLVNYMYQLPLMAYISDEELMDFHRQLEAFYKHT